MSPHRKHSRGQVHLIRLYRIFFCVLNGIIWCIWVWSHFAVTQIQQCYCNYATDVYHEMRGTQKLWCMWFSLCDCVFKYETDHVAMICTQVISVAQGTALMTDLFVSLNMFYSLILLTIKPQRKMFLCCVVCERYLSHILSWNIYQQERQLMTIISFHPCTHKNRDIIVPWLWGIMGTMCEYCLEMSAEFWND